MWSSVTERRIGTAGACSAAATGSSAASLPNVSKTDWIRPASSALGDGGAADVRRDNLGGKGEELAPLDALVLCHALPLEAAPAAIGQSGEQYSGAIRLTSGLCRPVAFTHRRYYWRLSWRTLRNE
jgi:hypothetical protein